MPRSRGRCAMHAQRLRKYLIGGLLRRAVASLRRPCSALALRTRVGGTPASAAFLPARFAHRPQHRPCPQRDGGGRMLTMPDLPKVPTRSRLVSRNPITALRPVRSRHKNATLVGTGSSERRRKRMPYFICTAGTSIMSGPFRPQEFPKPNRSRKRSKARVRLRRVLLAA